jgi:hypothetical protein
MIMTGLADRLAADPTSSQTDVHAFTDPRSVGIITLDTQP